MSHHERRDEPLHRHLHHDRERDPDDVGETAGGQPVHCLHTTGKRKKGEKCAGF